jgi:outer membrane lipoprotein-sorting protein
MLGRLLPGIAVTTLLVGPAGAQTVDELVAKSVAARGGLAKLKAVKSVRMTGTVSMGAMELRLVVELKRPSSLRQDVTFQGSTVVEAFDGKDAWAIPPMTGAPVPMASGPVLLPAAAAREKADQADFEGPLVDYRAKGNKVELVGKERLDGADVFKLKVTRKNGDVQYYFLSAETYLPVLVEASVTIDEQTIEGESTLGDYREVGGVLWAHSIQNGAAGQPEKQSVVFTKIEINPVIDDSRFKVPAGAKPFQPPAR